jgi:hypothetical protein
VNKSFIEDNWPSQTRKNTLENIYIGTHDDSNLPIVLRYKGFSEKDLLKLTGPTIKALNDCNLGARIEADPFEPDCSLVVVSRDSFSDNDKNRVKNYLKKLESKTKDKDET